MSAHNSVVGADQGFRAPSGDQESLRDSVHEDSASAPIAAGQRPRQSFRHPQGPPFAQQWCCNGSISIHVEDLNQWQPVPWGTRAHQQLYAAGRNRIENTNGIVKEDGGLSKKACRAPGVLAHSMAALALAVVSNVKFADEDPLADPAPDDVPRAELSLFCVLPAFQSNGNNSADTHRADHVNGSKAALPPRAPP